MQTGIVSGATDTIPVCLTIAGSDSSGGAGLQMDLAVFQALGCVGASVVTCVTAQSHRQLRRVEPMSAELVRDQLELVLEDLPVAAIKLGALATADVVNTIAAVLARRPEIPCVIDPVLLSTSGRALLDPGGIEALCGELIPLASLVTPNIPEAQMLTGNTVETDTGNLAELLWKQWGVPVLVKGGHAESSMVEDSLCDGEVTRHQSPRNPIGSARGTGCALASAIAAELAMGRTLHQAVERGRAHLQGWLSHTQQVAGTTVLAPGLHDAAGLG
jgi:hydroxymethylpyrimidine/phosphomethylpyrimidine kinase